MALGALKGTTCVLLPGEKSGGDAVSCTTSTKECPGVTFAVHVPVAVVGGMVVGQGTGVPLLQVPPGTGTLMSQSWRPPICVSGKAVPSVPVVGHVHDAVFVIASA